MRYYRKIIFWMVLLVEVFFSNNHSLSQDYWIRYPSPTTKWLYKCSFVDSLNGWAAGDSGVVIHTSDGGLTWQVQNTGMTSFIYDIFFLNRNIGWGVANDYSYYESTILKTTNGGLNWTHSYYPDSTAILNTVCFIDSLTGFMGGYQGVILRTTNAGLNWARASVDSGFYYMFHVNKIVFYDHNLGFAAGGIMDLGGVIWRTSNSGLNWHAYSVAPEPEFSLYIRNPDLAYGAGGDYEYGVNFVKSTDTGFLWEYRPLGIFGIGESVCFRTGYDVWIPLGFSQRWARSLDSGTTWREIAGTDSTAVYDAKFLDSLHGWAFGAFGAILKFNPAAIGINPISTHVPTTDMLYQNYPNPFNPNTTIVYYLRKSSWVKITVYDVSGKEVVTLMNEYEPPGRHTVRFTGEGLSSGVYFYKMIAGDYTRSMKMVLTK